MSGSLITLQHGCLRMPEYLLFTFVTANNEQDAVKKGKQVCDQLEGTSVPLDDIEMFNTRLWMKTTTIDECVTPLRLPMNENGVNLLKLKQLEKQGGDDALDQFREDFAMKIGSEEAETRLMDGLDREMCLVIDARDGVEFVSSERDVQQVLLNSDENTWVVKHSVRFVE